MIQRKFLQCLAVSQSLYSWPPTDFAFIISHTHCKNLLIKLDMHITNWINWGCQVQLFSYSGNSSPEVMGHVYLLLLAGIFNLDKFGLDRVGKHSKDLSGAGRCKVNPMKREYTSDEWKRNLWLQHGRTNNGPQLVLPSTGADIHNDLTSYNENAKKSVQLWL